MLRILDCGFRNYELIFSIARFVDLAETINFESRIGVFWFSSDASIAEFRALQLESRRKQGTSPILMVNPSKAGAIHGEGGGVETELPKLPKTTQTCEAEEH